MLNAARSGRGTCLPWAGAKDEKISHRISVADAGLLAFAGRWDRWTGPETFEDIVSCTIITRDADKWMSAIHHRMPAILHSRDFDAWLDGSDGKELLDQPPPELPEWIVSNRMNNAKVGDDDPLTAEPIKSEADNPDDLSP